MDIREIGQYQIYQNEIRERPASSSRSPGSFEEEDRVELGLTGGDRKVYDRSGKVAGSNGSPEDGGSPTRNSSGQALTEEEQQELQELKQTDRKVRAHEMAHMAAGGSLVRGGPNFEFRKGPDGNNYAVGGEVSIDASREKSPEQTLIKMQRVQAAALAPADPSGQDRAVASQAAQTAQQARMEIARKAVSGEEDTAGVSGPGKGADSEASSRTQKASAVSASPVTRSSFHLIA